MKKPRYQKARSLTLPVQHKHLKRLWGHGEITRTLSTIRWEGIISPCRMSREYLIRSEYALGKYPRTYVLEPNLRELSNGRDLPHVYSQKRQRLCLFYNCPANWNANKTLANHVLPHASSWLKYFEFWLSSGIWSGDEVKHSTL